MRKFSLLLLIISLLFLAGCSGDVNFYQAYEPYCIFEPYVTSDGSKTFYASVTLIRVDAEIPKQCYINGDVYDVVIFNGFANRNDAGKLYEIELPSFITAISSHAFEMANKIKTVTLNDHITSLGQSCLPQNLTSLTIPAEAICSTQTSSLWDALSTPGTLENLTITGTSQSSVSLAEFGKHDNSLKSITVKGYGARWPQIPHITKEGMKFLGWYTKDPTKHDDAMKAEPGKLVSSFSMTVYPYWGVGEDTGDDTPPEMAPMAPVNFYKLYVFGINKDQIHLEYNAESNDYTVQLDTTHWFWEWSYNGKPVDMDNSNSYTFKKNNLGKTQVMCFQCDSEGKPSGGALMVEL